MTPQEERQQVIDELAAKWFSRQRAGSWDTRERQAFADWLAEDPAHASAFREIEQLWSDLDQVRRPALAPRRRSNLPWRGLAAASVFCAALLLANDFSGGRLADPQQVQTTAPGEQREVTLVDGTRVFLAADSALRVDYSSGFRDVQLLRGEAYFEVTHDADRPFRVTAGDSRVRVLGTGFDVHREDGALTVAVRHGKVALQAQIAAPSEQTLLAGDRAQLLAGAGTAQVERVPIASIAGWRDGMLAFHNQPLGALVDELSQYRAAPIRLGDERLAQKPISGNVRLARPDDFLAALPVLLDVRVQRKADGSAVILPR
ncbi:transmembrane sensor [Pseudomonas nitritireducens]|uniref:Transmembrane sensor n=1 Tax=Pseudomonas nitroreducens TaxID=46680 RepID=A0A7W7KJ70_PSENT|nr:FecR family protein [Pseudomonas nitritireducens]MBB4863741.1 transmembrane sensor [Pseudomonas nitritireducens]